MTVQRPKTTTRHSDDIPAGPDTHYPPKQRKSIWEPYPNDPTHRPRANTIVTGVWKESVIHWHLHTDKTPTDDRKLDTQEKDYGVKGLLNFRTMTLRRLKQ